MPKTEARCARCKAIGGITAGNLLCVCCQRELLKLERSLAKARPAAVPGVVRAVSPPAQPAQLEPRPRGPQATVDLSAGPHREQSSGRMAAWPESTEERLLG